MSYQIVAQAALPCLVGGKPFTLTATVDFDAEAATLYPMHLARRVLLACLSDYAGAALGDLDEQHTLESIAEDVTATLLLAGIPSAFTLCVGLSDDNSTLFYTL